MQHLPSIYICYKTYSLPLFSLHQKHRKYINYFSFGKIFYRNFPVQYAVKDGFVFVVVLTDIVGVRY